MGDGLGRTRTIGKKSFIADLGITFELDVAPFLMNC